MANLDSTITCSECGHVEAEITPTDACQWIYECQNCGVVMTLKKMTVAFIVLTEHCRARRFRTVRLVVSLQPDRQTSCRESV